MTRKQEENKIIWGEESQLWGSSKGESYPDLQQTDRNQSLAENVGNGGKRKENVLSHYKNGL